MIDKPAERTDIDPFEAAYEGKLDLLKQWLESQADPTTSLQIRDKKRNWSPLIYTAASRDHTAVIQWILENGYTHLCPLLVHKPTPLLAPKPLVEGGPVSRFHFLIVIFSGDVNATNAMGSTALHGACCFGKLNSAKVRSVPALSPPFDTSFLLVCSFLFVSFLLKMAPIYNIKINLKKPLLI